MDEITRSVEVERFGALVLAYGTGRRSMWSTMRAGGERGANFWMPLRFSANGHSFRPLGTYTWGAPVGGPSGDLALMADLTRTQGDPVLLVAAAESGSQVVASPVRYQRLWWDAGTGASMDGSIWRPVPPTGYVALGDVWWPGWDEAPPLNAVWCVKKEHGGHTYARRPSFGPSRWSDWRTGGNVSDIEVWAMDAPPISETDTTERILLPSLYDTTLLRYGAPSLTDTSWILDVPADVTGEFPAPEPPAMTSYDLPAEPPPVTDRIVRVPFTAIDDPGRTTEWKIANSPFYTVQRQVGYKRAIYINNRHGSIDQPEGKDITTGFSKEESETFTETTSITVSASAGVSYKGFDAGASVSITREIGYERRTSIIEFNQVTDKQGLTAPPRSSAVLWVETHHLEVYRADGTMVGQPLVFQFPHYYIGEYPDKAGARHTPPPAAPQPEFTQAPDIDWKTGAGLPGIDIALLEQKIKERQEADPDQQPHP